MARELGPEDLVLCCGTVQRADFNTLVEAASQAGCAGISLQPHLYDAARAAGQSDAEMRQRMADAGVSIAELDALVSWLPGSVPKGIADREPAKSMLTRTAEDFFRLADAVGGRSLNVAQVFGDTIDIDQAAAALAEVARGAADHGLLVSLEFLPWSGIPDPATALAIVERTGCDNVGLMVDSWHLYRGAGIDTLKSVPGERVVGVQLNDAPAEAGPVALVETLEARLLPGEGDIALASVVRTLDDIGSRAPIGIEIYSKALARRDPLDVAREAALSTRQVLGAARQ